tara:strand:+ start:106 stop:981 length:876 start_codon:yes stop_codon:yes gene_type:complete
MYADGAPVETDEIFLSLMHFYGVNMDLLQAEMQGKFVSQHYPSNQTIGERLACVPPHAPQFKGHVSKRGQVWFERLYLDADKGRDSYMTSRVSNTVIVLDQHYGDEITRGTLLRDLLDIQAIPDTIKVEEPGQLYSGKYKRYTWVVTDPRRLPIGSEMSVQAGALSFNEGITNEELADFLSLTHQRTEPWSETNFGWRREGIQLPDTETVSIELAQHHTLGMAEPLMVLSMSAPYDPYKVKMVGPSPMTFFDRSTKTWRIPMSASPQIIGNVLRIWSLVILPDGTFLRSRI